MQLDLELVHIREGESFAAWRHGYPFRTVRWHYHPEYEIHLVAATHGKFYVGDHVGEFSPGQLIMTGPNLPQNWISDIGSAEAVPQRTEVIQFPQSFVDKVLDAFPEAAAAQSLFERSRRGILFDYETGEAVRPLMRRLLNARGVLRLGLFFEILDRLLKASNIQTLSSLSYMLNLEKQEESEMNRVIAHLRENLTEPISETELAEMTGQSQSAFSRSFKRHTGTSLVRFRNQLRIDLACQMLVADPDAKVSDICFDVGFSNLSNFNRHFLRVKGKSPSEFRQIFAENEAVRMPA
ncbi:helix-turn-helix domain-containing protein [Pacificibacter marinus]|uniref:helix-turn-helix domain-containing protein n=1 Tax=Pacificibacter marinus TaxID=658057 RepID=UPI001C074EC7|nr:helix-turn-helix domain-containing protein [Pacificibacter marinus]MBU2867759.1 helix-turn-helix domain-containing protein [Pacificibacter marinus]